MSIVLSMIATIANDTPPGDPVGDRYLAYLEAVEMSKRRRRHRRRGRSNGQNNAQHPEPPRIGISTIALWACASVLITEGADFDRAVAASQAIATHHNLRVDAGDMDLINSLPPAAINELALQSGVLEDVRAAIEIQ